MNEEEREEEIEQIAAEIEEERQEDVEEDPGETDLEESSPDVEEFESDAVDELEESEEVEGPEPDEIQEEPEVEQYPDYLEIVVDGQRRKVPSSKVWDAGLRSLQKNSAADSRLEEASNLKREAEESLRNARKESSAMQPSEEEMTLIRSVNENFNINFPKLANDPHLKDLVIKETNKLLFVDGLANEASTYRKAAENIQTWHDGMLGIQKTKKVFEQKLERKRAASGATMKGVNAKTTTTKKEPKEPSTSDIITEMRKSRGQPTL